MRSSVSSVIRCQIFSRSSWEGLALSLLVERCGWSVDGRDDLESALSEDAQDRLIVIAVGRRELGNGAVPALLQRLCDNPVVLFVRDGSSWSEIGRHHRNVMAVVGPDHDEGTVRAILGIVATGQRVFLPAAESGASNTAQAVPGPLGLTTREIQISHEVSLGNSNKEIARRLGIAVNTVNVHVGAIRRKLGVTNRTQIALRMAGTTPPPAGLPHFHHR